MVFSKDYCPFCKQAKNILDSKGIEYKVVELDLAEDGSEMFEVLKTIAKQNTVPCTYINGIKLGGCDDMILANSNGRLDLMLEA